MGKLGEGYMRILGTTLVAFLLFEIMSKYFFLILMKLTRMKQEDKMLSHLVVEHITLLDQQI